MTLVDWIYARWNRWSDDPLTGEMTLRPTMPPQWALLAPGEMVINPNSWFGQFLLASFDMREAADRMGWDWPTWD